MKQITVKRLGIGTGANEPVDILPRKEIERLISALDPEDVFREAYSHWSRGYLHGESHLDLRTGELTGGGYSQGECDQAVDSVYITLFRIDQNAEIDKFGECGCEYEGTDKCECSSVLLDEDGDPYNWRDLMPDWEYEKTWNIQNELDSWYAEENFVR